MSDHSAAVESVLVPQQGKLWDPMVTGCDNVEWLISDTIWGQFTLSTCANDFTRTLQMSPFINIARDLFCSLRQLSRLHLQIFKPFA